MLRRLDAYQHFPVFEILSILNFFASIAFRLASELLNRFFLNVLCVITIQFYIINLIINFILLICMCYAR